MKDALVERGTEGASRARRAFSPVLVIALGALAYACGGTEKKSEAEQRIDTIRMEQKPDRLVDQGKGYLGLGDYTRAEQYLAVALEHGASAKTVLPLLLRACVLGGRYRVAIDYAETHLRTHPDDADLRYVLGTIYSAVGDFPRAIENLQEAANARPNNAEAHFALAVAFRDARRFGEADGEFRAYLRLKPSGEHASEAQSSLLDVVPSAITDGGVLPNEGAPKELVPSGLRDGGAPSPRDGGAKISARDGGKP